MESQTDFVFIRDKKDSVYFQGCIACNPDQWHLIPVSEAANNKDCWQSVFLSIISGGFEPRHFGYLKGEWDEAIPPCLTFLSTCGAFSKTRLPQELQQVLSCESPAVFLHTPQNEKWPWGPFLSAPVGASKRETPTSNLTESTVHGQRHLRSR